MQARRSRLLPHQINVGRNSGLTAGLVRERERASIAQAEGSRTAQPVTKRRRFFPEQKALVIATIVALGHAPACAQSVGLLTDSSAQPQCAAPADLTRLDYPLERIAKRVAASAPIKILAIGSSSTAGAGASSAATTYPSRLLIELDRLLPRQSIAVLNRGINGQEILQMLARFPEQVIQENPDLVLWQLGTNAVLRDHPLEPPAALLREGLRQLWAAQADVILIDPQFAPKVLAKPEIEPMIDLISAAAQRERADLFHRFAIMRHWHQAAGMPFEAFLTADQLHMNDWGYGCFAKLLANSITDAASRSTVSGRQ
jgi:acyl-CoA thioesterase I